MAIRSKSTTNKHENKALKESGGRDGAEEKKCGTPNNPIKCLHP